MVTTNMFVNNDNIVLISNPAQTAKVLRTPIFGLADSAIIKVNVGPVYPISRNYLFTGSQLDLWQKA